VLASLRFSFVFPFGSVCKKVLARTKQESAGCEPTDRRRRLRYFNVSKAQRLRHKEHADYVAKKEAKVWPDLDPCDHSENR
jgi:hypothetical protein